MELEIKHRYLVFPVNTVHTKKRLSFWRGEEAVYSLNIHLDNLEPTFWAYVDVERFRGERLTLTVEPAMELSFRETDEMELPDLYREAWRPRVHFTTKNGWSNDPNGLIYLDGVYHMFYQHNPCAPKWDNMHWGHATSTDLLHWTEEPIALFPDANGTVFSGSAILDVENRTGLAADGGRSPAVLLYYSASNQYMAYSTDGLKTIQKYNEPVIPHVTEGYCDPNVNYCEELSAYLMAIYVRGEEYAIFRSDDLLHWTLLQKLELKGDHECPDLFPITDNEGTRKWVLMGARDRYLVGDITEQGFVPSQEIRALHYGRTAYAGQTFSGLPNGRIIRMDWEKWKAPTPSLSAMCQMSLPCDLTLERREDGHYLAAKPIPELKALFLGQEIYENLSVSETQDIVLSLEPRPYHLALRAPDMDPDAKLTLTFFGRTIDLNMEKNLGEVREWDFPLSHTFRGLDLEMVIDRMGPELYLDEGRIYAALLLEDMVPDPNLPSLRITADRPCKIERIELHPLESIWKDAEAAEAP
ncbi:MAG: glycoside hydrolase family 32 protein [Clostridia bacterium]|nr:glycoside hydrolase family 32 protein [Clostridia bacterium]